MSVFTQILYSLCMVALLSVFPLSHEFWKKRHHRAIAIRAPVVVIVQNMSAFLYAFVSISHLVIPDRLLRCAVRNYPAFVGMFTSLTVAVYRCFSLLFVWRYYVELAQTADSMKKGYKPNAPKNRKRAVLVVSGVFLAVQVIYLTVLFAVDFNIVIGPLVHPSCTAFWTRLRSLVTLPVFVDFVVVIYAAFSLRTVKENFSIKRELSRLGKMGIWGMFFVNVHLVPYLGSIFVHPDFFIQELFAVVAVVLMMYKFSLWDVLQLVKAEEIAETSATMNSFTGNTMARENHIVNKNQKQFRAMIEDKEGFLVFKQFLVKEFSVENILFWKEATAFVEQFRTNPTAAIETAKHIYVKYIRADGENCVNIGSRQRNDLDGIFENESSKAIEANTFDKVIDEIVNLMRNDSFHRFRKTIEYEKWAIDYEMNRNA